jgi:hypothetical protein
VSKKTPKFLPNLSAKIFKNHSIGPWSFKFVIITLRGSNLKVIIHYGKVYFISVAFWVELCPKF